MRRAAWLAWVTAAALLLVAGLTADDQSPRPAPHVVLISIDGLRPDTYLRADGPRIPTLRRLVAAGAYASGVVGVFPTLTYPSHTSLITGVTPREHGIVHNRFLRPTDQPNASWYWFARDITAPTLAGAVHASGRRSAAVSWPVTVGADLDLLFPEYFRSDRSEAFRVLGEMSRPATLLHDVEKARGSPLPWPMTDGWRTEIAAWMFKKYQPHLLLLHLLDTDAAQHESGPDSERTRAAIEAADASVRHVLDAVEAAGLGDRTNVVIVSDHGFAPVTRQLQPNALFKREGWLQVDSNGQIVSWRVFFQPSGGSGFVFLENPRDAALTTRVAELLAQLAGDPAHGIDRVIHGTELKRLGADPRASFAIDMREGFYTAGGHDVLLGESIAKGGHGYHPARRPLHGALLMAGPNVPRLGDLGVIRMTQIAPLLASWFDVRLSPAADASLEMHPR